MSTTPSDPAVTPALLSIANAWPGAVVVATPEGTVVTLNEDARALLRASAPDEIQGAAGEPQGTSLATLFGDDGAGALRNAPATCHLTAGPIALEARSALTDGGLVVTLHPASGEAGLRSQIDQAERLASIGELLSSVAHELNNPLTSVLGFAEILLADDDPALPRDEIACIRDEAQRCRRIVKNLLDLARSDEMQMQPLLLQDVVRKVEEFRAYAAQAQSIDLRVEVDPDLPFVTGDFHRLVQAVLNLATNAEYAVSDRDGEKRIFLRAARDGAHVAIEVEDNGPGVPVDARERIFQPFFTTKPRGRGTGLGLSLVRATAEAHGGSIRVERAATGGARFVMRFATEPLGV